jgi:DNA-binding CsgD family transcriptional regulator
MEGDESGDERRELKERAARLTPREWRVMALVLEGSSTQQACDALGVAPGTFESHKQAIRRKLMIPRGVRLVSYLQDFVTAVPPPPEEAPAAPVKREAPSPQVQERRVRWLLRLTMQELLEVAGNADLRATLLEQTVSRIESEDVEEARAEVEDLRRAAIEIRATLDRLLDGVRARRGPSAAAADPRAPQGSATE